MSVNLSLGRASARQASASDLDFVLEVYGLNFKDVIEEARGWDEEAEKEYLAGEMSAAPFYILTYYGSCAGFLSYVEAEDAVHIRHMEVHPDFSGRGIGTAVIRSFIRSLGGRSLRVAVSDGNHRGMEFYTNLGFKAAGRIIVPMKGARDLQLLGKTLMQHCG